ncbi:MAG: hypothetical protein R3B89_24895 [Polyangiaceae bacterium]
MRDGSWTVGLGVALLLGACGNADAGDGGVGGSAGAAGSGGNAGAGAGGTAGSGTADSGTAGAPDEPPWTPQDITPPPVELPPRPEFSLGMDLGSPGWRGSTQPFCSPLVGYDMDTSLWSTPEAVYLTVAMNCTTLDPRGYCSGERGTRYQSLLVNQGSGWQAVRHQIDNPTLQAVGTQGDALISTGFCAAGKSALDGSFECLGNRGVFESRGAVVRGDSVFHLAGTGSQAGLLTKYQDGAWSELARFAPEAGVRVLLDLGDQLLVAGDGAFVALVDPETGATKPVAAPAGDYVGGASMPGGKYALVNDEGSVALHASEWTTVQATKPLAKLRAAPSGSLYALGWTPTGGWLTLHRIDETGASEVVLELEEGLDIQDFSVNSDSEIFLLLGDFAISQYQCGGFVMTWFDGNQLHLM